MRDLRNYLCISRAGWRHEELPNLSGQCFQKLSGRIRVLGVVVNNISRVVDLFLDLYRVANRHGV